MRHSAMRLSVLMLCVAALPVGCARHSHKSVSTYEYNNEPARAEPVDRQETNELDSEYKMVSPGEMRGR